MKEVRKTMEQGNRLAALEAEEENQVYNIQNL